MAAVAFSEKTIGKRVMDRLKENIGKEVSVDYVLFKWEYTSYGVLKEVHDFNKVVLASASGEKLSLNGEYLMQGWNNTIKTIKVGDEVLYDNSANVSQGFKIKTAEDAHSFRAATFGTEYADAYAKSHPKPEEKKDERSRMRKFIDLIKTYRD